MSRVPKIKKSSFVEKEGQNNCLLRAIRDAGYTSVAEFARKNYMDYGVVNDLIHKRHSFNEEWMTYVYDVMQILNKLFHELFDVEDYERFESEKSKEEQKAEFAFNHTHHVGSVDNDPLEYAMQAALQPAVDFILLSLTPRERFVINNRFGIDRKELQLYKVGELLDVTQERVRQIEAKALRKLRHPTRCDKVRDFVIEEVEGNTAPRYQPKTSLRVVVSPQMIELEDKKVDPPQVETTPKLSDISRGIMKPMVHHMPEIVPIQPPRELRKVTKSFDEMTIDERAVGWLRDMDHLLHVRYRSVKGRIGLDLIQLICGFGKPTYNHTQIVEKMSCDYGLSRNLQPLEIVGYIKYAFDLVKQTLNARGNLGDVEAAHYALSRLKQSLFSQNFSDRGFKDNPFNDVFTMALGKSEKELWELTSQQAAQRFIQKAAKSEVSKPTTSEEPKKVGFGKYPDMITVERVAQRLSVTVKMVHNFGNPKLKSFHPDFPKIHTVDGRSMVSKEGFENWLESLKANR